MKASRSKPMESIDDLIERSLETKERFTLLRELARDIAHRKSVPDCFKIARELFDNREYHPRALATYIFGNIAATHVLSLAFLRKTVSHDTDWRIQEILAQGFDNVCSNIGYERSLPLLSDWLSDSNPNVRRAVTEGLRIWTGRPYFDKNPHAAVSMLSAHRADSSAYVRKSVGNALKDISKKHAQLVRDEIGTWDLAAAGVRETHRFASKHLEARGSLRD